VRWPAAPSRRAKLKVSSVSGFNSSVTLIEGF
jgi:hypothetical protein